MRRRAAPLLLGLVLVTLTACGGGTVPTETPSVTPGGSPDASPNGTPTVEVTPTPAQPTDEPNDDPVSQVLAWIIGLAPGSPSGPEEVGAYKDIQEGTLDSCRQVLEQSLPSETQALYRGAAAACLAALHGREGRWTDAEAALDAFGSPTEGCLNRATFDLLDSVVTAHRQFPDATFERKRSSTIDLPCPTIEDVTVTRDASDTLAIQIRGDRLRQVLNVAYQFVDSCPDEFEDTGLYVDDPFTSDRRSIRATLTDDPDAATATLIWVGLMAHPEPWIGAGECATITDAGP